MVYTSDFREGLIFQDEHGQIVEILEYQHHRKSQARAVVRVKLRNLDTGSVIETSYRPEDKFNDVLVEKRPNTYMYSEGGKAMFMDTQTYDQVEVPLSKIGDAARFLTENMEVLGLYLNEKFYNILLPAKVTQTVRYAEPGVKGDSVSNMLKRAELENGVEVKVPLFVNTGDKIVVDTRTSQYVERVTA